MANTLLERITEVDASTFEIEGTESAIDAYLAAKFTYAERGKLHVNIQIKGDLFVYRINTAGLAR